MFAVLMIPAVGLAAMYANIARVLGQPLLDALFDGVDVRLQPIDRNTPVSGSEAMLDTNVVIINRRVRVPGGNPQWVQPISLQWLGYLPTALLVCLVLCSPIPWRRRLRSLLIGLLLVQVFVACRVAVLIAFALSKETPLQLYHPGPLVLGVMRWLYDTLTKGNTLSFAAPLLFWVLVSFRREDWKLLEVVRGPRVAREDQDHG